MKKSLLFLALLSLVSAGAFAQESRQDVSVSAMGVFPPSSTAGGNFQSGADRIGGLASYRYMLTPRSAVEGNFGYWPGAQRLRNSTNDFRVVSKDFEISGAYVFNFTYGRFNPFLEGGVAGYLSRPDTHNRGTTNIDAKSVTNFGGLFGAGVAYELSPSFDLRVEYRGLVTKAPTYKIQNFGTSKYGVIQLPTVGIAYHF